MLIKTLTILTSLFAFAAATSMAQTNVPQTNEIFYGPNVVGFIEVVVKPNAFALLSNPFSITTSQFVTFAYGPNPISKISVFFNFVLFVFSHFF
jgi:hypothetical protein